MTMLFKSVPSHNNGASTDAQILLWLLLSHNFCRCCFWKWHVSYLCPRIKYVTFSTYLCIRAVPYTQLGVEKLKNKNNHSRMLLLGKENVPLFVVTNSVLFNKIVTIDVYIGKYCYQIGQKCKALERKQHHVCNSRNDGLSKRMVCVCVCALCDEHPSSPSQ